MFIVYQIRKFMLKDQFKRVRNAIIESKVFMPLGMMEKVEHKSKGSACYSFFYIKFLSIKLIYLNLYSKKNDAKINDIFERTNIRKIYEKFV